jgi:hypothetical protein
MGGTVASRYRLRDKPHAIAFNIAVRYIFRPWTYLAMQKQMAVFQNWLVLLAVMPSFFAK